jgi:hypothetical protein
MPPTASPTATATSAPTATPVVGAPAIAWGAGVELVAALPEFLGRWSPARNEMVGYVGNQDDALNGTLRFRIASEPDFALRALLPEGDTADDYKWSPDGERLALAYRPLAGDSDVSLPAVVGRDGSDLRMVSQEQAMHQQILGWLEPEALALANYEGGGHWYVSIQPLDGGTAVAGMGFYGQLFPPDGRYIPVGVLIGSYPVMLAVLTPEQQAQEVTLSMLYPPDRNVLVFPQQGTPEVTKYYYRGWQPGTTLHNMLVQVFEEDIKRQDVPFRTSELDLWDVERNQVRRIAPGGLAGQFSADGQRLALVSAGQVALSEQGQILTNTPVVIEDPQTWLSVLDIPSGQVIFQSPVTDSGTYMASGWDEYQSLLTSFSPDGQYMAFLRPDEQGGQRLEVVELAGGRAVLSAEAPADVEAADFVWAHRSPRLLYVDAQSRWWMFSAAGGVSLPVTEAGVVGLAGVRWSFDDLYASWMWFGEGQPGLDWQMIVLLAGEN